MRLKAVSYARVSSKEQEDGFSISAQQKLLRQYATSKGFEIIHEYTDVETAKKVGRTSFRLMLDDINDGKADVILVEKTDRLTRNLKDYVHVDDLIQAKGIEVHLVKENDVWSNNTRSQGKFMHGIRVLMAKNYIDNLAEEVKKGMYEKADQGYFPGPAPYGYRNNKETRLIDVDEAEAPLVRRAFELYATGNYSLNTLRLKLFEEGFCFKPKNPKIPKASLEAMLKKLFYTGDFMFKDKFYKGKHTPLVPTSLFEQVQEQLSPIAKPKMTKRQFAFTGLMTCGYCDCSITAEIHKGRYIYYRCTNGRGKCKNAYVREEKVSELFAEALKRIVITEDDLAWLLQSLKQSHQDEIEFHRSRLADLQKRQALLLNRIDLIYEDKLDGKISEDLWQRKHDEYKGELKSIEGSLSQHNKGNLDYIENGSRILELAKNAYSLYVEQDTLEQRRILNAVLSNSTLKDGKLSVTYRFPFSWVVEHSENPKWWALLDSNQ